MSSHTLRTLAAIMVAMMMMVMAVTHPCQGATIVNPMNGRKVVLMSMDGFRYDYLSKTDTPNFDAMIASGVKVPYVNNTFATWTFPCHYSIATGVYEESHGIVANRMYDPLLKATFTKGSKEAHWWDGAEPIWINAVKSGRKTGVYFWPGSETELSGHRPTHWMPYNKSTPFERRVDVLVSDWLAQEDFQFGVIYFHEPDMTGHIHGPDSPQMADTIKMMDGLLGYFMDKLEAENLTEKVDLVLTSDHGMTSIDETTRVILLEDHVDSSLLEEVVIDGAVAHLRSQPGKAKELARALAGIEHSTVYLKQDIPDRYYYKHHRRVMPVIVVADEGWSVKKDRQTTSKEKGNHGYSSDLMSMRPIFMARGRSFKQGVLGEPIKAVDIYPLLCHLLDIPPAPNNGSLHRTSELFRVDPFSKAVSVNSFSVFSTISIAALCSIVPMLVLGV